MRVARVPAPGLVEEPGEVEVDPVAVRPGSQALDHRARRGGCDLWHGQPRRLEDPATRAVGPDRRVKSGRAGVDRHRPVSTERIVNARKGRRRLQLAGIARNARATGSTATTRTGHTGGREDPSMSRTIDLNADLGRRLPLGRGPPRSRDLGRDLLRGPRRRSLDHGPDAPGGPVSGRDRRGPPRVCRPRELRPPRSVAHQGRDPRPSSAIRSATSKPLARSARVVIRFVKPHGALYNQAQVDADVAAPILGRDPGPGLADPRAPRRRGGTSRPELRRRVHRRGLRRPPVIARTASSSPGPSRMRSSTTRPRSGPRSSGWSTGGIRSICLHGDDPRSVGLVGLVPRHPWAGAGVEPRGFA